MIEMLVVISIIWILIATLSPQVWNSQEKSRDIEQQTHIQELASALISYKLDYWKFPIITGSYRYDSNFYYLENRNNSEERYPNWWSTKNLIILKENKYISTIHKNPNNRKFTISDTSLGTIYDDVYSIYISNWNSFAIIAEMENESQWNCNISTTDIFNILTRINNYNDIISKLSNCVNENNWTWNYYVYVYANTIE